MNQNLNFNDNLFSLLLNAEYAKSRPSLNQIMNILSQKSDGSRKACINHNCRLAEMPFCWDYYLPENCYKMSTNSNRVKVISFPMVKISTGWRFYLDIEDCGEIYISEGKGTRRTPVNPSILNDFSYSTRKEIYDTVADLCFTSAYDGKSLSPYEFLKRRGESPNCIYSYIESANVPSQTDVLEIYGFKHKTTADCEIVAPVKINRYNDVLYVGKVERDSNGEYRKVRILKDGDLVKDIDTLRICGESFRIYRDGKSWSPTSYSVYEEGFRGLSGKEINDWFNDLIEDDKDYFISRHDCRKTTRKWSEIREMSRPRIFVMDKSTEGLCHHFYDDVAEINLDDESDDIADMLVGRIRFENDHYFEFNHEI